MKKYFRFIAFLIVLLSAGYIFLVHTVMPKYIRQSIPEAERLASSFINGSITLKDITWNGGLSAEVGQLEVKDAQGQRVVEIPRIIVHLRPWLALDKGARTVSRVELVRPQVYLSMDDKQQWNMAKLLKPSDSDETPFYGLLEISNGVMHVAMPQGQWDIPVSGTVNGGANPKFALGLRLGSGVDTLAVGGLVTTKGEGRIELKSDKLALAPYAALAKHYAGVEELKGDLSKLALIYVNEKGKQRYSGEVNLAGLEGKMQLGDAKHSLKLDGQVRAHDSYLNISSLEAVEDCQKLALEGEADLRDTDAPSAKGVLTADKLAYEGYKLEKLRLPFRGDKKEIILENVAAAYGGGAIKGNATYSLEDKVLTGDLELKDVSLVTPDRPKDDVHINAKLALLAKVLEDKLQLHAATEVMEL